MLASNVVAVEEEEALSYAMRCARRRVHACAISKACGAEIVGVQRI